MTSAFPDYPIPSLYWICLACERQNPAKAIRCLGCGRSAKVATDHGIWDKYPPRQYLTVDAVIAPAPVLRSDLVGRVLSASDDEEEHEHIPETEDIADGVVGGGLAHVYVTRCTTCGEEMDPEEPE